MTGRRIAAACWHAAVTVCLCALVGVGSLVLVTVALAALAPSS